MALKVYTLDEVTIATAGTRVCLASISTPVYSVLIAADSANTGKIYVGDVSVDSTNGIELSPSQSVEISGDQMRGVTEDILLSDIYLDTATNGNVARVAYIKRR